MARTILLPVTIVFCLLFPESIFSMTVKDCMVSRLETAGDALTIGELRLSCEEEIGGGETVQKEQSTSVDSSDLVDDRIDQDAKNILRPFTLMAHKPNFILLGTYNSKGYSTSDVAAEFGQSDIGLDKTEMQFQLSIKFPLLVNLFSDKMDIYAAYTNRSFWQFYNDASSPFRESNHEPEIWFQFHPNWKFFGFTNSWNSFGFNHQSNGQAGNLSRSWNRFFAWLTLEHESLALSFRPWLRIQEEEEEDDNPEITDYLGHFELSATYKWHEHVFSMMSRNNLESGFKRGAVEFSWSFPLIEYPYLKGYVQYFHGYGESLIDYDQRVNRIGLGLCLVDWL